MAPDHVNLARIDVELMREFLSEDAPNLNQCIWIGDLPAGRGSVGKLRALQTQYGSCNVTTGRASRPGWCGIYVRSDVLERPPNWLREVLSRR